MEFRRDVLPLKNMLYRLALRITLDTAEAEDVVQETFIRIWEKREAHSELKSIEAYGYTVCRNLALDRAARKEALNLPLDEARHDTATAALSADEEINRRQRYDTARRLLDSLPERLRTVVQLRDVEEKSYREIADMTGLTEDVVRVSLHRARRKLREEMEKIEKYGL